MKNRTLLFLAFSAIFLVGCNQTKSPTAVGQAEGQLESSDEQFSGSLQAAVKLGVPFKCSYQFDDNQYEGYIKGQQYAGKMVTPAGVANVIMKDNCMWTWQEGTNQGMTTCFEPTQGDDSIWDNPDISSPDIEYTCFPAVVNDDMFSPPDSVSFTDLDSLMNGQTIPQM